MAKFTSAKNNSKLSVGSNLADGSSAQPPPPTLVAGELDIGVGLTDEPLPDSEIPWGLPAALVVTATFADNAPALVGVNVTTTSQEPEGGTGVVVLQAFTVATSIAKSAALLPIIVSAVIESTSVLLPLVMVLIFVVLLVFRPWLPKSSDAGAMLGAAITPDVPMPDRFRVC